MIFLYNDKTYTILNLDSVESIGARENKLCFTSKVNTDMRTLEEYTTAEDTRLALSIIMQKIQAAAGTEFIEIPTKESVSHVTKSIKDELEKPTIYGYDEALIK